MEKQLEAKTKTYSNLQKELEKVENRYIQLDLVKSVRSEIDTILTDDSIYFENVVKTRIIKKPNNLYEGSVLLPDKSVSYINLSDRELTDNEREFLDLGINLHLDSKFNKCVRVTELELLHQSISKLEEDGYVTCSTDLRPVAAEAWGGGGQGASCPPPPHRKTCGGKYVFLPPHLRRVGG